MKSMRWVAMGVVIGVMVMCESAWTQTQKCKPSPWGPDDEIGAANRITPESVLAASQLIKSGKVYSLGFTIDRDTPAFPPRTLTLQVVQPGQQEGKRPFPNEFVYNDDAFQGWFGIGSQIDGLGHAGWDGIYYNCNNAKDFLTSLA